MMRAALIACLAAPVSAMPAMADPMAVATAAAGADCRAEGGTLELAEGAAVLADLTGDGSADDAAVWEYGGFCGPDLGFRGGSGGAMLHLAVGDVVTSVHAGSWTLQDVAFQVDGEMNPPVRMVLIARHGSYCDSFGASPCVEALVWSADERRFLTVMRPLPEETAD
jgi:hypothetical protein